MTEALGFVAIGRNEGDRLKACLTSLVAASSRVVYVDSASSDDSVAFARGLGVDVVDLDMTAPFTAARARNAGYEALIARWPDVETAMFIDGDCALAADFPSAALAALAAQDDIGVVTGRCREARRDATIYNTLCDMEWDGPIGEIEACGGIFVARCAAFDAAGGFDPDVIAAEDDEFCIRVRENGFRIIRIDADMCFHDAAMTRFSQWWTRAARAGHAFAQVGAMHRGYFAAERRRALAWGLFLPAIAIIAAPVTNGLSLGLFALYPVSYWRTRRRLVRDGAAPRDAGLYARFLILSKFPAVLGLLSYWRKKLTGRQIQIVEYK
ncbi:MAG: glycosyltransferase [Pseudomonadota bacterium]